MPLLRLIGLLALLLITGAGCHDNDGLVLTQSNAGAAGQAAGEAGGPGTVASLELTPRELSLAVGTSSDVQATRVASDGTTADVTSDATWTSSAPEVATVEGGTVSALKRGTAEITVTASGLEATLTVTVTGSTLLTLSITPPSPILARGLQKQLTATGVFTDNTTQDLTKQVTWTSATKTVASVGADGLLTAVSVGSTNVSAKFGTTSATTLVTVSAAVVESIALTPPDPSLPKGMTRVLMATATLSDGTTEAVSSPAEWTSSDESVATVNSAGVVTAIALGTTTISVSVAGVTGATKITVVGASLVSIGVTPAAPTVVKGLTKQFTAMGSYSDGTLLDLTNQVTWASNSSLVAAISNAGGSRGLAAASGVGSTSISATYNGVSGSTTLTVSAATLVSIGVTPAAPAVAKGLTRQFTAMGTYTDASTQNLTTAATWASSDTTKATISNAAGSEGLASTAAVGSTSISATLNGITGTSVLTVGAATLVSIGVTPATPSVAKGLTRQFMAVGSYTDASTQNLTATATWASSDSTKVTISNATGSQGLASAGNIGSASISATYTGVSGSTTLTVSAATLVSIAVTPAAPSVAKGLTSQFTATGTYTDASTQILTTAATWASSDTTKATISNAAGSEGLVTTAAVGSTSILATFGGITGATTLTVSAATLVSISVTPAAPSVAKGLTQQFTAVGSYTDASTQNLTATATWASSDSASATISNAVGSQGLATGAGVGSASISATFTGVSGSTTLTVGPATLVSIAVTPANSWVFPTQSRQFTATGTYTDSSTQGLTTNATWASSIPQVTISNAVGSKGLATADNTYFWTSAQISATVGATVGSTTLYLFLD